MVTREPACFILSLDVIYLACSSAEYYHLLLSGVTQRCYVEAMFYECSITKLNEYLYNSELL